MNKYEIRKMRQAYRAMVLLEQQFETNFGLNMNEAVALCHLWDNDGMCTGEMAAILELSKSNASKVMTSIEKMGYVHRKIDKEDKRSMHFLLTPKGKQLIEKMHGCDIPVPDLLRPLVDDPSIQVTE